MLNIYPIFALILIASVSKVFTYRRLVVLSFDGFHPRHLNETNTPHLQKTLLKLGAKPPSMTSVFPTKKMVTHFSVATGVYPEDHGVYGDEVFGNGGKIINNEASQFQSNPDIIPIWTENQREGRNSAVMMWPGSEFTYKGITPKYSQKFDTSITWDKRASTILDWMSSAKDPPSLLMAYFEYKPCNDKTKQHGNLQKHLMDIDNIIKKIYDGLKDKVTGGEIDIIIMSDHGKEIVSNNSILKIEDFTKDIEDLDVIVSGPIVFIKPKNQDKFVGIRTQFEEHPDNGSTHSVHTRKSIMDQKMDTELLEGVIILIAKPGFTFYKTQVLNDLIQSVGNDNLIVEENGYFANTLSMEAFFLAIGQSFRPNITLKNSFSIMNVYPLIKQLLELPREASSIQKNVKVERAVNVILKDFEISTKIQVQLYDTTIVN